MPVEHLESPTGPYELYTISGAPRPWRVALALVAKGLPFTLHVLEGSRKEQKEPRFLALNPRGRTPVLVNGDFVLTESLAIIAHLDRVHPEPPLFPDPARVWEQVLTLDHDLREASNPIHGAAFQNAELPSDAGPKLLAELRRLEARLATAPFLCGDRMTAADCVAFPEVRLSLRAAERAPELMRRLELAPLPDLLRRWVDRIEALPGYERTFPAHWR
jgi:glutathione S-transferase